MQDFCFLHWRKQTTRTVLFLRHGQPPRCLFPRRPSLRKFVRMWLCNQDIGEKASQAPSFYWLLASSLLNTSLHSTNVMGFCGPPGGRVPRSTSLRHEARANRFGGPSRKSFLTDRYKRRFHPALNTEACVIRRAELLTLLTVPPTHTFDNFLSCRSRATVSGDQSLAGLTEIKI